MNEIEKAQLLADANERLRSISAALVARFGADDVAGLLLVASMSVMGIDRDAAQAAKFLRDLADEVASIGIEAAAAAAISRRDLN